MTTTRHNSRLIYSGPSALDGAPIVAIVSGLIRPSQNVKTGPMLQTWIMRADQHPVEAINTGADASVCGACPLRKSVCYVNVGQAPAGVWRAYERGTLGDVADAAELNEIGRGKAVRVGSYGDPAAVPITVWTALLRDAATWTGYTHQWRRAPRLKTICMASTDTPAETLAARSLGWRTFSLGAADEGAILCPNETVGVQCADCTLCAGTTRRAKSIAITPHGKGAKQALTVMRGAR